MITHLVETTTDQRLSARQPARGDTWARLDTMVAVSLALSLLILKIAYCFAYSVDSDETQHLHVVWGWANGFLPYRDLFDNHSPLFQFLCSPLFRLLGERPDIVIPMRALMIPLYFLCLWCTYQCGKDLVSKRAGVWAALLTGAYPNRLRTSTAARTAASMASPGMAAGSTRLARCCRMSSRR